nr:hypothetical protein [uncultured Undibacterium sp.]
MKLALGITRSIYTISISIAALALSPLSTMSLMFVAASAQAATLSCSTASTLEALVDCISNQMPKDGSNGFVVPTTTQKNDYKTVVTSMLQGNCNFSLPSSISANMAIRTFTDSANGKSYCLLMEVKSTVKTGFVDKGWGTFIVNPTSTRLISHNAPHPKYDVNTSGSEGDSYTEREAIRIFKQSNSRSYLMAGSRRSANKTASSCQSEYWKSDCAHNTDNMYYPANEAMKTHYGSTAWYAIEWHGKAASTCSNDMYLTEGLNATPATGSKVLALKSAIQAQKPTWVVQTPGTGSCSLNATTNTAGRLLNGVASVSVCGTQATSASGRFIHIEQTSTVIGADLNGSATAWANAIIATFP